jgi:hypothetical protein
MPLTATNEDATGPISGLEGTLTLGTVLVANLKKFTIDRECDVKRYATGDTAGWEKTLKGVRRWSGSADLLVEQGILPALVEGTLYAFSGVLKTSATPVTGVIRMGKTNVEVDVETGEPIGGSITFEGHGALAQSA